MTSAARMFRHHSPLSRPARARPVPESAGNEPHPHAADEARYGVIAIALHWVLALLIVSSLGVGLFMTSLPFSPLQFSLFNWHKWAGITILALSALRLLWRLTHTPPPLSPILTKTMRGAQLTAHHSSLVLLYVLFFAVPLLGWAYSSALGFPVVWFGVLPLPDFVPVNQQFAETVLKPLHQGSAFTLAIVVVLHAAAALKHQWIDRDRLLQRMWPVGRRKN